MPDTRREERDFLIVNKKGLHARASVKFAQIVEKYDCEVTVSRCGEVVNGQSIMGLLTLGAALGTSIKVEALGLEAKECLEALSTLIEDRFGEEE